MPYFRSFAGRGVAAALVLVLSAGVASAQIGTDFGDKLKNRKKDADGVPLPPHAAPTLSTKATTVWPRLEAGATVCRSRSDLDAYIARLAARQAGTSTEGMARPDCRVVSEATAIDIVERSGPGATEVRLKPVGQVAWTDSWLPTSPPRQ